MIFMIKQCSTHILPTEQEFAQVLISIVQASNIKLQFKQDTNSVFSVPQSVRHPDFDNNNNNNTCMEDIEYIVGKLISRVLFANYSTPQAKKRGLSSKQIEDSVQKRRNAKKPKLMSYDVTLLDNNNESERALKLFLLSLTRFYERARTKVLRKLLALRCLVR